MAASASAPPSPARCCAEHPRFGKVWPGVLEAVNLIGSTQVQGRASAGGNLCNGSPAGDSVPAMVAAGAIVTIAGAERAGASCRSRRCRRAPAAPICSPAKSSSALRCRRGRRAPSDAYLRMIPRTEMDIAVVGVRRQPHARQGGVCTAARVGLGAVAPTVLLVEAAAKALIGSRFLDERCWQKPPPPAAPPAVRSTTSAAPLSIAPRSPACC